MPNRQPFSDTTRHGVRVGAVAFLLQSHTNRSDDRFTFGYKILIHNTGTEAATLLGRHWDIVDGEGNREEVEGQGVVGHQPRLEPGQAFQYNSFSILKTEWGTMEGFFLMQRDDESTFHAQISRFFLTPPRGSEVHADVLELGVV